MIIVSTCLSDNFIHYHYCENRNLVVLSMVLTYTCLINDNTLAKFTTSSQPSSDLIFTNDSNANQALNTLIDNFCFFPKLKPESSAGKMEKKMDLARSEKHQYGEQALLSAQKETHSRF